MISKIEHVGLEVKDLDRSVEFYSKVLGMKLVGKEEMPGLSIAFMQVGDSQLELLCHSQPPEGYGKEGSFAHLALTVDDIDACVKVLRDNGVECTFDAPKQVFGGNRIFFFKGPDNEVLEFFQPSK